MYWAVARTRGMHEELVQRRLERQGFEVWYPRIEEVQPRRGGKLIKVIAPLFRCYVFVRVELQWHDIRRTDGVTQVVFKGDAPARLDDAIVDALKARTGPDGLIHLPKPRRPSLRRGDRVRIRGGPLAGRHGIFEGMRSQERVAVLLGMLGAPQRVELPAHHVEAVDDQDEHDQV
jgi:transcriptional antiterminator RfaH